MLQGINVRELQIDGIYSEVFNNIVKYNTASNDMVGSLLQSLQMDFSLIEASVIIKKMDKNQLI